MNGTADVRAPEAALVLALGGRCPVAGRGARRGQVSRQLPRDGRAVPADRPRDLADAFVLPGEQYHVLALLDAKMAAMAHGCLLRCMSLQVPS